MSKKIIAVVPAAGIGSRMESNVPKQYMKIKNYTILEYTLMRLLMHPSIIRIIVSLHHKDAYFQRLSISSNLRIISVLGGQKRIYSVLSGLMAVKDVNWVIIHDAVRPCLSYKDLDNLICFIHKKDTVGAILARPVSDTIKYVDEKEKKTLYSINRVNLWHALTPQLFRIDILKYCLNKVIQDNVHITDEASALEYCGYNPLLVLGSYRNIKVTYPEDFILASLYLKDFNLNQ